MRALCGAIITAGALIGLGLTALGYGLRYGGPAFGPETINPSTHMLWGSSSLMVILIVLLIALLIGLGTAFLGWPSTIIGGIRNTSGKWDAKAKATSRAKLMPEHPDARWNEPYRISSDPCEEQPVEYV
jgi:hypothetical protein